MGEILSRSWYRHHRVSCSPLTFSSPVAMASHHRRPFQWPPLSLRPPSSASENLPFLGTRVPMDEYRVFVYRIHKNFFAVHKHGLYNTNWCKKLSSKHTGLKNLTISENDFAAFIDHKSSGIVGVGGLGIKGPTSGGLEHHHRRNHRVKCLSTILNGGDIFPERQIDLHVELFLHTRSISMASSDPNLSKDHPLGNPKSWGSWTLIEKKLGEAKGEFGRLGFHNGV